MHSVQLLDLVTDMAFPERDIDHRRLDVGVPHRLHDGRGDWDHLNLIFPVYLKLMTGFPFLHLEDVGAGLLH